jgi:muramoyltetrapeptide carboxypeptidase
MPMNRRHLLRTMGLMAALPAVQGVLRSQQRVESIETPGEAITMGSAAHRTKPWELKKGSRIGIACPASGVTRREIRDFVQWCSSMGFDAVLGRNVAKMDGYLSAPDEDRADELKAFVDDPSIEAIICARGGYGVMRILPMLDYKAIAQSDTLLMGFSDITALLVAVDQLSHLVTFHGPVAVSTFDQFTTDVMRTVLMPSTAEANAGSESDTKLTFRDERLTTLSSGLGRGRLTGGNLSMVVSTLGTNYEIDTEGAILFLEEINEEPYRIDRMLTQMWLAGKLQKCNGIALGNFKNCEARGTSISGPSHSLKQVLEDRLKPLGVPVVYGLPFGHVKSKLTLPLGVEAELDATHKSIRLLESAVRIS